MGFALQHGTWATGRSRPVSASRQIAEERLIAVMDRMGDSGAKRMHPRHQCATGRRTGGVNHEVFKPHALACQLIHVRRFQDGVSMERNIPVALFVGEKDDHIRSCRSSRRWLFRGQGRLGKQEQAQNGESDSSRRRFSARFFISGEWGGSIMTMDAMQGLPTISIPARDDLPTFIAFFKHPITSGKFESFYKQIARLIQRACGMANLRHLFLKMRTQSIKQTRRRAKKLSHFEIHSLKHIFLHPVIYQ